MFDLFLTRIQKDNLGKWQYQVEDLSITTKIFSPFWNYLVTLVPTTVAPNILSLAGLLCILYAFNICHNYLDIYPRLVSFSAFLLIFGYMNLDAIDGKHARRTNNSSPLGELFDHSCDNIGVVFMIMILCYILGITNPYSQWYFVQLAQLVFLNSHIDAYKERVVKFGLFSGPGEFLVLYMGVILGKTFHDYQWIDYCVQVLASVSGLTPEQVGKIGPAVLYYTVYVFILYKIWQMKDHYSTKNGLLISLTARIIPSVLIYLGIMTSSEISTYTIISHGLIMSVLTGDIIVAKMASRELHPLIPIFIMLSLFDNFICISACAFYYLTVLTEISFHLRIPIMSVQTNVFCNGVFDLCHEGHMNLFEKAASYGTRLVVGVLSDKDVEFYKRRPNMTHKERCSAVEKQKYVDKVIPNTPMIVTEEFIKKHNIDLVVCSAEYDKPDDKYYAGARKLGILQVLPRTDGVSTSELIKRVKKNE